MSAAVEDDVKEQVRAARRQTYREAILQAAGALFGERGFTSIAMADIAKAAGIAKGTLYNYFDSKEEVFAELAERGRSEYLQALDAATANLSGWERLAMIARHTLGFLQANAGIWSAYLEATGGATKNTADPGRADGQSAFFGRVHAVVAALQSSGQLRPQLNADLFVTIFAGALDGLQQANLASPDPVDLDAQVEALLLVYRHGAQR